MLLLPFRWSGVLDYTPALNNNLNVDDTQTTFAGVMNGRYKVYVDPYAANVWLLRNTTLSVIRELHLMTPDCSTAHTFLSRWFVRLVRIGFTLADPFAVAGILKSGSRLVGSKLQTLCNNKKLDCKTRGWGSSDPPSFL